MKNKKKSLNFNKLIKKNTITIGNTTYVRASVIAEILDYLDEKLIQYAN